MTDPQTGPLYLGIDVGGTNIKAGIVTDEGNVIAQASVPTEAAQGPDNGVGQMAQASQQALKRGSLTIDQISAVGLATPGTMDIPAGLLLDPPNLPGWNDYPVRQKVSDVLGRPTILQNDANAAAYGEYWAGSASNADSLVFFTLGTGLGGGLIVDDTIVQGEH
ncbi:MAG: ROK family protein, partial [Fuerstiella sp.]|nr:ROK family protein [Fuerstiella sp.]